MKRLLYIFIFLLSLLLMCILSSCRSPKTVTKLTTSTDSVKVTLKDSATQRFSFTFDSLKLFFEKPPVSSFSTTDDSGFLRMQNGFCFSPDDSCLIRNYPQKSVVNKNLPFSHLIVYGGKLYSDHSVSTSHDSIRNKSSTQSQHSETPDHHKSLFPVIVLTIIAIIFFFIAYKLHKSRLS